MIVAFCLCHILYFVSVVVRTVILYVQKQFIIWYVMFPGETGELCQETGIYGPLPMLRQDSSK